MTRFAAATCAPVLLLVAAGVLGGVWIWAALAYLTLLVFALDRLRALAAPGDPGAEFPAGTALSVVLGLLQFPLLALAVVLVAGKTGATGAERVAGFLAFALFLGQVGNSNAHELIHRSDRRLRRLGVAVYASVLYGHHASAHPLVHHVHVGTAKDPNSPRGRESFYRYLWRVWRSEYRAGKAAETARRARAGAQGWHPYLSYAAISLAALAVSLALAGLPGLLAHLGLAAYVQSQLMITDYVQHYRLPRAIRANGKPEPCGPQHSWNTPHWCSSALMLNAPRHSDHHTRPGVAYPGLRLDPEEMPTLPHSLPVMALIALWPAQWRRVMDPLADRWQPRPAEL
ncbi:alkane 1-monooxygenase [Marinovum sp.]|uniref:alkane 1-monooxygenase n=1 Tax=Marinovum sp. TaxID=2024839 RepID=UPI002B271454|nr:alkane 1-monooxygenase [Marinovum sp.]